MPTSYKMRRKVYRFPQQHAIRASNSCSMLPLLLACIIVGAHAAPKLDTQLKLLINDDDLLMQPENHAQVVAGEAQLNNNDPDEPFNLYRSELKRLSYETIHRILRDENEPNYRREDTRYYQKRSYKPEHEVVRRAAPMLQELTNAITTTTSMTPRVVAPSGKPAQHMLKLTHAQLQSYDAARDYQGEHRAIYELDLSNNQLREVNLSAFTALRHVELANNALKIIPLNERASALNTIEILNLNNNQIAHATNVSSAALRELHLSGNQITQLAHLNLSMLSTLETLDLSCNRIAELETAFFPQRMHNLRYLNLAHNRIGTIYRETFYNLLSLNTLLLSHNNISDIDYETFLALPNLQYLDLSYNQLRGEAIRALQGIPDLVRLSIAYNPEVGAAMQEFVASWSLKELDASGTGLCQIPAALAQSVRTLKLTDNWLKIINCGDLDSYPLLQYLDLSHSRIEDIEDDALGRLEILETLFLDHNQLPKVPLSLPTSLEHLFLQNNEIMDIHEQSFQGLNNLQTLDLSGNKLFYLPALPLPKLLTLNLRAAGLRGVSQAMVHTLPRLRDLLLDENPIKCSDLLSIAEWASPCRIVEQRSSSSSSNSNTTELESLNIEGNSIMGDMGVEEVQEGGGQRQEEPQSNDNRIGFGQQGIEQIIAISGAVSDKLGQQHAQVQQTVGVVREDVMLLNTEAAAANNELKQKFVRMHNFFEKFKSNCGARKQTSDKRVTDTEAHTHAPPACAIELEGSSEQIASEMQLDHNGATLHLPNDNMRKQSEKSNVNRAAETPVSMQQQNIDAEDINNNAAQQEDNVTEQNNKKREMKDMSAVEAKLMKFNQKNFTRQIAESAAGAVVGRAAKALTITAAKMREAKSSSTDFANYRTEAASDYRGNASEALATTAMTIKQKAQTYQTTKSQLTNKSTAAPSTAPTNLPTIVVAKTFLQETGTGQSTAVNLWGQYSNGAKTATTTEETLNRYSKGVAAADDMQSDAPKSMLESAEVAEEGEDSENEQEFAKKQKQQEFKGKDKSGRKTWADLKQNVDAPKSMLAEVVKTENVGGRGPQQRQVQQKYEFETKTDTKTTTADEMKADAPKSMLAKAVSEEDKGSREQQQMQQMQAQQLQEKYRQKYDFETKTTAKLLINDDAPKSMLFKVRKVDVAASAKKLQLKEVKKVAEYAEKYDFDRKSITKTYNEQKYAPKNMQAKAQSVSMEQQQQRQQIMAHHTADRADKDSRHAMSIEAKTTAMPNMDKTTVKAATTAYPPNNKALPMPADFLQMSRAQVVAKGSEGSNEAEVKTTTKSVVQTTTTMPNIQTTTATAKSLLATRLQPQTTIPTLSLDAAKQPSKDNILTQNDNENDYDGYKMQQNVTVKPTKRTQFWQQHNFKRAYPYPNDDPANDGQRHQSAASGAWEVNKKDELETEHATKLITAKVTTTTSTHLPPAHKHEPLQLHVRDRHLIGTPLLQHRGENMLVEAVELHGPTVAKTTTNKSTQQITTTTLVQSVVSTAATALRATTKNNGVHESAMSDYKALATSQPTQASQLTKGTAEQESGVSAHTAITVNSNAKNNNNTASNTKHAEAEAINVETNVTPMQRRIGSGDMADKQMLAGNAGTKRATTTKIQELTTKTTIRNIKNEEYKATTTYDAISTLNATNRRAHKKKHDEIAGGSAAERRSKPSLIMRKMTIQTKHAQQERQQQPAATHYTLNTPRENEAVLHERAAARQHAEAHTSGKHFMNENSIAHEWETEEADMAEHAEVVAPLTPATQHKHSTVNTPIIRRSHERLLARLNDEERAVAEQEQNAQHALGAISNQQRERAHAQEREPQHGTGGGAHSQTQKLLDVRKMGASAAHPGLVILITCSLFFVLLIGLMQAYRCDILPWRRAPQRRPHHQLQFNAGAGDDDAHSFLHYHNNGGGGQQMEARQQQQWLQQPPPPPRWHHGTRERAPYSSPLHNLHVRELQKTSAVELEAGARVTRSNYDIRAYATNAAATATKVQRNGSGSSVGASGELLSGNSSSSLSSTRSSSTAGIMDVDDGTFYVEMASECGGVASEALHSDMLPMELLAVTSARKHNDASVLTVQETNSLRLGGDDVSACNKKNEKQRVGKCGNALLGASRKSKKSTSGTAHASSSSSARKFDLW